MRSRADLSPASGDRGRQALEWLLRAAALALLAYALWQATRAAGAGNSVHLSGAAVDRQLQPLIARPLAAVDVTFDETPTPAARDLLAAMAHAGTRVSWRGAAILPLAVAATRLREPGGPVRLSVVSPGAVELRDDFAILDTVRAERGAALVTDVPAGAIVARSGTTRGVAVPPPVTALRRVLVVGRASWESKFVVVALEEQGWIVDARIAVAPGADVTQGAPGAPDTSRYSAVVVLDSASSGAVAPGIARFVRDGGGLVLLGGAANAPAVRALAPAHAGPRRTPVSRAFDIAQPRDALPLDPLDGLRADAVRLTMRGALVAAAARREGAGRVVQVGYEESWRWRMEGGEDAPAAHRLWWSHLVGSVAANDAWNAPAAGAAEGAPLAGLVDALGASTDMPPPFSAPRGVPPWILPVTLLILLGEWASRRLRGAR